MEEIAYIGVVALGDFDWILLDGAWTIGGLF